MLNTPKWYFESDIKKLDALSNFSFLVCSMLAFYKKKYLMALSLLCVTIGSTIFHLKPNEKTLFLDRLSMIFAMSVFYNLFYSKVPIYLYFIIGLSTLFMNDLLLYGAFQLLGVILFLENNFYRNNYWYALIVYSIGWIAQIFNYKYIHVVKHLVMGLGIGLLI